MKIYLSIVLFFISLNSFCQTEYYTSDGVNRITKTEAEELLTMQVDKLSKAVGKKFFGNIRIDKTEIKNDSIISKISFEINDKKKDSLNRRRLLAEFVDRIFPKFELSNLSSDKITLEQLKGKPTMINLWFTTCAPCIDEMPILNKIKEKYENDFNFIAITFEKKESVEKFLKKHQFEFEHLINGKNLIDKLGVNAFPMNLFLDKNGVLKVVAEGIPYDKLEGGTLKMGEGNDFIAILEKLK